MAEKKQPAKTIASPTLDNVRVNPVYADALRYLLFAQELDPTGRYARFVQNLAVEGIPYRYTDPRFLAALVDFVKDFKTYLAEARIPEVRIESSVPHVMVESLAKELTAMPATIRGVKRERIEQITNTYVKQLRRVVGRFGGEETFKKNLTEEVTRLAQESNTIGEFEGKLEDALTNKAAAISTDPAKIAEVARPVAHNVLSRATDLLPALLAPSEEEPVVTKALIESSVKRKDLWVKTYTQKAGREAQPNTEDVNRLAATAEAFLSVASGPDLTKPTLFFRTGAKGLQKPLAILADTMLEVFPKETRDAVIESVLRRGWDVATQTDKLNKKFGELVVDSGVLQAAIEKGNLAFGTKEPRSFRGLTNAASDIASTLFGAPRSTEDILALVELGIIKEDYIAGWLPSYVAGAHANRSGLFDLIFNLGANWGIQRAAAKVGGKVAGSWLGKLIGGAAGAIGGPVGAFLGAILGSALFNRIFSLFGRRPTGPPPKWYKDWSPTGILFPVVLVAGPILLISALSILINPITLGGAFQQQTREATPEPGSPYITLTKTPSSGTLKNGEKQTIEYTITVTAKDKMLKHVKIVDSSTTYPGGKTSQAYNSDAPDLNPGESHTKTYSVPIAGIRDAVVVNTLSVSAQTDSTKPGETEQKVTSSSVVIGSPQIDVAIQGPAGYSPAGWCNKDGPSVAWKPDEWAKIMGAFASFSAPYMALVKQSNPQGINIYRINWSGNYWGCTDEAGGTFNIYIYNGGIPNVTYILAHELGHRISDNDGWFSLFKRMAAPEGATAYASRYAGEQRLDEDFAETMAMYVAYPDVLKRSLPRHYAFAQCVFGGIPASQCQ